MHTISSLINELYNVIIHFIVVNSFVNIYKLFIGHIHDNRASFVGIDNKT